LPLSPAGKMRIAPRPRKPISCRNVPIHR
jgi:hypothetical protein